MKFAFAIVFALFLFGCAPVDTPPSDTPLDDGIRYELCNPPAGCRQGCPPKVAGRYHLRGRTKRFFGRVS